MCCHRAILREFHGDLSVVRIWTIEETYQFILLSEEKLQRRTTTRKFSFPPISSPTLVSSSFVVSTTVLPIMRLEV